MSDPGGMQNLVRHLALEVERRKQEDQKREHDDAIDRLLKIQSTLYDKSSTYTKVILGLGYATFFAIWSASQNNLSPFQSALSGLCMGFSLLVYILFEIFQMIHTATHFTSFARTLKARAGFLPEAIQLYEKQQNRRTTMLVRVWVISLALSIPPGLCGALILIYAFARKVWLMMP